MPRPRSITIVAAAAAIPLTALAVAGCGGGGGAAATLSNGAHSATVRVASQGSLGNILVDAQGRTLYLFKKDAGAKSACFGGCASEWPPLRAAGTATVGAGANAALLATTARSDGSAGITYNGHPLYRFAGDTQPGDANGQGLDDFGGAWYALSPAGRQISARTSAATGY